MSCKVFVGNLPWRITRGDLVAMLADMGHVYRAVNLITDHDTGKSRGFAFVEVDTPQAVFDMIRDLDGHVVDGRPLRVREAEVKSRGGDDGGRKRSGGGRFNTKSRRRSSVDPADVWGDE